MSHTRSLTIPSRLLRPNRVRHLINPNHQLQAHARRSFLNFPDLSASKPQILTAQRTLPYAHLRLYDLIADIDSYSNFLPYCKVSRVTAWTDTPPEDSSGSSSSTSSSSNSTKDAQTSSRRWPIQADLTAGWGGLEETYTSRVFCCPPSLPSSGSSDASTGIVEAISGQAHTEISASTLSRHEIRDPGPSPQKQNGNEEAGVFESLVTRWTVRPAQDKTRADRFQHEWSDVSLSIQYRFKNPLYGAVSSAVADKVAPVMVEAFVERAKRILGEPRKAPEREST